MYTTGILLHLTTVFFERTNFDYNFNIERSETSDNRPYTTSNIISEPSSHEFNPSILYGY